MRSRHKTTTLDQSSLNLTFSSCIISRGLDFHHQVVRANRLWEEPFFASAWCCITDESLGQGALVSLIVVVKLEIGRKLVSFASFWLRKCLHFVLKDLVDRWRFSLSRVATAPFLRLKRRHEPLL